MRNSALFRALSAAASIALFAGCSGGAPSSFAPRPQSPTIGVPVFGGRISAALDLAGPRAFESRFGQWNRSFFACPATGPIKYVSDGLFSHSVVNIYVGRFAGQAPCGQITSGLASPNGLFVQPGTHDLYVANFFNNSIRVFHRGQTTPYNTYINPHAPPGVPNDVAVAKDGTVIVTYLGGVNHELGGLATWIGGPNGGTFVGNFPMARDAIGEFLIVKENGTIYFDTGNNTGPGGLWSVSCPAGACGTQKQVSGVSFSNEPAGMAVDATGDILMVDSDNGTAETFELPNPSPSTFPVAGTPLGMAINRLDHHMFVVDSRQNRAWEYSYPSGTIIGTVPGNPGGIDSGIAVDP